MFLRKVSKEIVYDQPKSMKNYIPEGTYFTGHLLSPSGIEKSPRLSGEGKI